MRLIAWAEGATMLGAEWWHGLGVTAALGTQPWQEPTHLEQHIWMWWALSSQANKG